MDDPNRAMLEAAAKVLEPLLDEVVLVGGCATGLLVTDPAVGSIRPTIDIDVITEVGSYVHYSELSIRLRNLGLIEDTRQDAPTCRWRYQDQLIIDVMPTDEKVLGFSSRWYQPAIASAQETELAGLRLRVIAPVHFIATKIEAFRGRGHGDYSASHDLEDVMTVIDGRPEILGEVSEAEAEVRIYIASEIAQLLGAPSFREAIPGFLLPDPASQARHPLLLQRLDALAHLE